jgi:inner membrane transporter RhtA
MKPALGSTVGWLDPFKAMLLWEIDTNPSIAITTPTFKSPSVALPIGLLVIAMMSFQLGAVVAKHMFASVGAAGTTALRLGFSCLILLAIWRPWRIRLRRADAGNIVIYGLAMGLMNFLFYLSLHWIPLGIAVALEFTGPLGVAMATSRRAVDFLWIGLAALGLVALLPLGLDAERLSVPGVAAALGAGVGWAVYIVFGRKAGDVHGGQTAALGTLVGAMLIVPFGIAQAGSALLSPAILPAAFALAMLSSALPYSLEMYALTRLPTRTFGVLMSGDPALGALAGLVFLGEKLSVVQWAAIGCIVAASAGIAYSSRSPPQPVPVAVE